MNLKLIFAVALATVFGVANISAQQINSLEQYCLQQPGDDACRTYWNNSFSKSGTTSDSSAAASNSAASVQAEAQGWQAANSVAEMQASMGSGGLTNARSPMSDAASDGLNTTIETQAAF